MTTDQMQKVFDKLKHGFTTDEVVVRITPLEKKSITQMVQLYDKPNDPNQKFVEINETYRWGYGYMEGEDLNYPSLLLPQNDKTYCDPTIGHGAELDDLCSVWFDYDGPWTDEEKQQFEETWENGDPEDPDGRSGFAWLYDWNDTWQIEDEQLIIDGPVKYDIMDKNNYSKIHIEDYKPQEENNG